MTFRKTLAVTTALSAVALLAANAASAAEAPKLKIGGYQDTFFGVGDMTSGTTASGTPVFGSSQTNNGDATILAYGEMKFEASGTTDSGMKYGVYFELSIDDGARNSNTTTKYATGKFGADEANVWLSGSWGKLEIGNQDGAADKMAVGGTEVDMLGGNILGAFFQVNATTGSKLRGTDYTNVGEGADNTKVTYYTPRISGFQAGLSYAPRYKAQGTQPNADDGINGSGTTGNYEAGIGWQGKVGDAKVEVVGVATSYLESGDPTVGHGTGIGAQVEMNNITVAAGYARNKNWRAADAKTKAFDAGIGYNGGKWQVALYYLTAEGEKTGQAIDDKFNEISLQAGYNFGGGLTGAVGLYDFEIKEQGVKKNDGQGLIAKLTAKF
jgi:predicted porin